MHTTAYNWNRMPFDNRPQDFISSVSLRDGCGLSWVLIWSKSLIIHDTKGGKFPLLEDVISRHIQSRSKGF